MMWRFKYKMSICTKYRLKPQKYNENNSKY